MMLSKPGTYYNRTPRDPLQNLLHKSLWSLPRPPLPLYKLYKKTNVFLLDAIPYIVKWCDTVISCGMFCDTFTWCDKSSDMSYSHWFGARFKSTECQLACYGDIFVIDDDHVTMWQDAVKIGKLRRCDGSSCKMGATTQVQVCPGSFWYKMFT